MRTFNPVLKEKDAQVIVRAIEQGISIELQRALDNRHVVAVKEQEDAEAFGISQRVSV